MSKYQEVLSLAIIRITWVFLVRSNEALSFGLVFIFLAPLQASCMTVAKCVFEENVNMTCPDK